MAKGLRIVTKTWLRNSKTSIVANAQFNLWDVQISGSSGNRTIKYNLLHTLKLPNSINPYEQLYVGYHNTGIHAFSLSNSTYSLHTDKIILAVDNPILGGGGYPIGVSSIRPDKPFTWITESAIFDGDPRTANTPFAKIIYGFTKGTQDDLVGYSLDDMVSIGDVNNDGLNDVAAIYGATGGVNSRIFRIYLGIDGTTSVKESHTESVTIKFPHPIDSSKPTLLRITSTETIRGTITLFTHRGEIATTVWSGELQQGENSIPFDAQRLGLSRGWYNLRFQLGSKVIDKALIIE